MFAYWKSFLAVRIMRVFYLRLLMANSGSLPGVFFCMTICVGLWGITNPPGKGLVCLALAVRAYARSPEFFARDGSFIR